VENQFEFSFYLANIASRFVLASSTLDAALPFFCISDKTQLALKRHTGLRGVVQDLTQETWKFNLCGAGNSGALSIEVISHGKLPASAKSLRDGLVLFCPTAWERK
jgi:hypothetical protein